LNIKKHDIIIDLENISKEENFVKGKSIGAVRVKINIYYGGRGLVGDPTLFVLDRIREIFDELHVKTER
jgi:hypothetical protein